MSKKTPSEVHNSQVIASFKGFDANFQCRGFQFEVGKSYEHNGPVEACKGGFHACEHPLDIFSYYPPATSRFARVIQSGTISRHAEDTKIASARITIEAELSLPEVIAAAVKWVHDRVNWKEATSCTGDNEGATNRSTNGAATASGYQGAATASGTRGAATASGTRGAATASGYHGAATASGYQGAATASGDQGAATASGFNGRVRGKDGSALFLVYRPSWNGPVEKVWAGIAGRNGIKADTFYCLRSNGQPVECGDGE